MKKLFKVSSLLSLTSVFALAISGCSCSMKQNKVNEKAKSLSESSLDGTDFNATYLYYTSENDSSYQYTVSRDLDNSVYYLEYLEKEDEVEAVTTYKVWATGTGSYYYNKKTSDGTTTDATSTNGYSPAGFYKEGVKKQEENLDFYSYITSTYEIYKNVPLNACSTEGNAKELPDIDALYISDSLSCKATKKSFSKEVTYTISYRVSLSEITTITIKTNGDNKITYMKRVSSVAIGEPELAKRVIEYTISYDDLTLTAAKL